MTSELQKCREEYERIPEAWKHQPQARCLLTAIEIAEKALDSLKTSRELCDAIRNSETDLRKQLNRINP